jgi:hypothetical protein
MSTKTDQLPDVKNRDQKRVTLRHHDPMEISFAPAGAQAKINPKINAKITGGAPC